MADHLTETVKLPAQPSQYAKSLLFVLAAALTVVVSALTDNVVTTAEVVQGVIVVAGAVLVYVFPNTDSGPGAYAKTIVAVITAAGTAVVPLVAEGGFSDVTPSQWITVVLAALGALGVFIAPNTATTAELLPDPDYDGASDESPEAAGGWRYDYDPGTSGTV